MAGLRRMLVGLKQHDSSEILPARFIDCIVNFFFPNVLRVKVSCEIKNDMLVLSPAQNLADDSTGSPSEDRGQLGFSSVILQHSPECPVLHLEENDVSQLSEKLHTQGVYVGVSMILESLDHKILLTQRADHMRAFPRVWVPPGGHLECGEKLAEAAFRELIEETGLKYDFMLPQLKLLCLWESVYPVLLGFGVPKNHHIVVYYHLQVQETWEQLQNKIQLDPEEVQACTWLDEQNVENLFQRDSEDLGKTNKFCIQPDGSMKHSELDLFSMFHPSLWQEKKIYSGTQLALNCWLSLCKNRRDRTSCKM